MISPVAADVEAAAPFEVDPREPVFAGHYPGFPIFPGVCLIELAHRSALAASPDALELAAIESARFLSPVFPSDRVATELDWRREDDGWRCSAALRTERGKAAQVRLRYRERR